MDIILRDQGSHQQFGLLDQGQLIGELDFVLDAGIMTITHTGVRPAFEGKGLGRQLVRSALEKARAEGWRIRSQCSYASAVLGRIPDAQPILLI